MIHFQTLVNRDLNPVVLDLGNKKGHVSKADSLTCVKESINLFICKTEDSCLSNDVTTVGISAFLCVCV